MASGSSCDENSLGILNMDNLKVFGETSDNTSENSVISTTKKRVSKINERLNSARQKALEILDKPLRRDTLKMSQRSTNKENLSNNFYKPQQFDQDFLPYHRSKPINISDLVMDKSINLNLMNGNETLRSLSSTSKISFEPSEITGRSTHYSRKDSDIKQQQQTKLSGQQYKDTIGANAPACARLSVSDILASSFAPKARNLCETLNQGNNHKERLAGCDVSFLSGTSSSFTSYNGTHSLPHTADLSKTRSTDAAFEAGAGVAFSFNGSLDNAFTENGDYSTEFVPGELMQSKLLLAEISWAQEYATIPEVALSEEAIAKAAELNLSKSTEMQSLTSSNISTSDPNFSIGNYFNKRSGNILSMVEAESPRKVRKPIIGLVENITDNDRTVTSTNSDLDTSESNALLTTPKCDNKTYNKDAICGNTVTLKSKKSHSEQHESKDSGNATQNTYLFSLSTIDRALRNLDVHTDDSDTDVVDVIRREAKKYKLPNRNNSRYKARTPETKDTHNNIIPHSTTLSPSPSRDAGYKTAVTNTNLDIQSIAGLISENKENLDPELMRSDTLSDTVSFSESFLKSTDIKSLTRHSSTQRKEQRSPLSPIEINKMKPKLSLSPSKLKPRIIIISDNEADIDELPSALVKSPNINVRRVKSPQDGKTRAISPVSNLNKDQFTSSLFALATPHSKNEKTLQSHTPQNAAVRTTKENTLSGAQGRFKIAINSDNEADIDEFPSTPVKSPNRRVRRVKSPQDTKSPAITPISNHNNDQFSSSSLATPNSINEKTLTNQTPQGSVVNITNEKTVAQAQNLVSPSRPYDSGYSAARKRQKPKSLCSTRLESSKPDFAVSSNPPSTSLLTPNESPCRSPAGFNVSPMSLSPHSYCLSSQNSSPCAMTSCHSPQLDVTTLSERIYLTGRMVTSPLAKETAIDNKYGTAPARSCSCNSIKSTVSTASSAARSTSRCSNSSEFSHRDGKVIPLKVTTLEMSWNSTKLRSDSRKSMQVKNIANKRLVVRLEVQGPGFQIVNNASSKLTLQSQECRSIIVQFCPTVTGVAVGKLCFYAPQDTAAAAKSILPFLVIPLYGYGGHCAIMPQNILKGPVGAAFLPMGNLRDLPRPLERIVTIYNKGPLPGFAIICIDSIGLHLPRLCDAFEIRPDRMLIPPGCKVNVQITFRPRRDDIKKIMRKITNVLTLVNMRIICGDEANRQRMRHLMKRMSTAESAKIAASNTLEKLWSKFSGECEMPELKAFKERAEVTYDLLTGMRVHEIALTLNHESFDETRESPSTIFSDGDDTVLFRTVCASSPVPTNMLETVDELLEANASYSNKDIATAKRSPVSSSTREGSWSVRPHFIEFDFNNVRRTERVLLHVHNSFKSRQYFEVVCNYKDLLHFIPSKGYVEPDDQVEIEVHSQHTKPPAQFPKDPIAIMIHMERDSIMVPVHVPKDNY